MKLQLVCRVDAQVHYLLFLCEMLLNLPSSLSFSICQANLMVHRCRQLGWNQVQFLLIFFNSDRIVNFNRLIVTAPCKTVYSVGHQSILSVSHRHSVLFSSLKTTTEKGQTFSHFYTHFIRFKCIDQVVHFQYCIIHSYTHLAHI